MMWFMDCGWWVWY